MPDTVTRRTLLNASLAGAVSLSVSALVPRRAFGHASRDAISSTRLGDDLWLFAGAGGNVGYLGGNPDLFLKTAYEGAWLRINEIRRVTR
jgi:hypothetical protein